MFGISGVELAIIVVVALVVFGPRQLPEVLRTMARAFRQIGRIRDETQRQVREFMREVDHQVDLERRQAAKPASPKPRTTLDVTTLPRDGMTGDTGTAPPREPFRDDIERT